MKDKFILSHDMGTSTDKAVIVSVDGTVMGQTKSHYPVYHPHPNYAEQDPMDWWNAVCQTTRRVIKETAIKPEKIVGITFSSQTQSLIPVSADGSALRRAIIWLDGRSADIIRERLWTPPRFKGYNIFRLIKFLTITGGCPGHTGKDQIGKILWIEKNQPEIFSRTHKFLDAKDFIICRLTGNMVTSVDIAYIWWLLDSRKNRNRWHEGLCKSAGIRIDQLADVKESSDIVGRVTEKAAKETGLVVGTPVINGAGDLSSAALGSGALGNEEFHVCIGTSGWVAGHVTKRKIDIPHYTGCIGSAYPKKYYLAMAHQETIGICLEWLKNNVLYHKEQLKKEVHVSEIYEVLDRLAEQSPPGAKGLIFTPWMYGERCPLDDDYVRGGLFNLSLDHQRQHIVRAVFEGIAFNLRWAIETVENLYSRVSKLNIIGGGAKSNIWCQIVADITDREIHRVENPQLAGAVGVALLASMKLGYIKSFNEIKNYINIDRVFYPDKDKRKLYDRLFKEFKNIYKQNKKWYKRMNKEADF